VSSNIKSAIIITLILICLLSCKSKPLEQNIKETQGVWIGQDSFIIITDYQSIAFLRINDTIVSVYTYKPKGTIGVIYGQESHSVAYILGENENIYSLNGDSTNLLQLHSNDYFTYNEQTNTLSYTTYDGTIYENNLVENLQHTFDFSEVKKDDSTLSTADKMALWTIEQSMILKPEDAFIRIVTKKYIVTFAVNTSRNVAAGSVRIQGFTEQHLAQIPIINVLDNQEHHKYTNQMWKDMLVSFEDVIPDLDKSIEDGSFELLDEWAFYGTVESVCEYTITVRYKDNSQPIPKVIKGYTNKYPTFLYVDINI